MARVSGFKLALKAIIKYFESEPKKVFSYRQLSQLLYTQGRGEWLLPESMSPQRFVDELIKHTPMRLVEILSVGHQTYTTTNLKRYIYGDVSPFEVALSIRSNTYLSHYSSIFLLGLTEQLPKAIYVTLEQSEKINQQSLTIDQETIDQAFTKPQREPSFYYQYLDYRIILLNGKFSKKAGLSRSNTVFGVNLPITGLERTLVDITVRPAYAGGVTEVLKAYERAADTLSVNKLLSILAKLDYIYPYHQAIGFYLQKASIYKERQLALLKEKPQEYDFYLTYNIGEKEYSKEWRLYYPKNL
jgi:hypothetical protein